MPRFMTLAQADQILGSGGYLSPLGSSRSKKHGPGRVKDMQDNIYLSHNMSFRNLC